MSPTAIVTGGAGGMGLATARIMGRDHRVVVADLDRDRVEAAAAGLRADGVDAVPAVCDITDRASVAALFATARAAGDLRAVVYTAGVSPQMGDAAAIVRINALGTVHLTRAALDAAAEGFALVNVASIAGHMLPSVLHPTRTYRLALTDPARFVEKLTARANLGPASGRPGSAYASSKSFVIWYTRRMAGAFGAKGARVLSVSPGTFDTAIGRLEEKSGSGRLVDYAALRRYGRPEEIAEHLAFCASTRPGYLTGTDILCDGGTRAGMGLKGMIAMARGS
ncbi:SDR family oxidoreductase [Georgenia sp. TF02-10]|uniref:SDR family NAD(P)-dependent oxidoreductase n=1 Tax=Georgenia sp. TF02-10 TaxID=2917725 RepID=UPI001FA73B9B|nr:SDR family oxidoreductase [Georgenia sp. TF02-10]UNX56234.1 SDR family oxidoreductase [Georgenia sp. TF02-10]